MSAHPTVVDAGGTHREVGRRIVEAARDPVAHGLDACGALAAARA